MVLGGQREFSSIAATQAAARPDKVAYICLDSEGQELSSHTFLDIYEGVEELAGLLNSAGLAGRRVLMLYETGLPFILAFLACLRIGAVPAPCHIARPGRAGWARLTAVARDADVAAILSEAAVTERLANWLPKVDALAHLPLLTTDRMISPSPPAPERAHGPNDLAFLQYTSGSTGDPKGTMVTHRNLVENALVGERLGLDVHARLVCWVPAYHDMGLIGNILQTMFAGACCILLPPATVIRNPAVWLKTIDRYQGTVSAAPNFAYGLAARRVGAEVKAGLDLSSWRFAANSSEPIRAETIARFVDAFAGCGFRPTAFRCAYGLAEATLFVTMGPMGQEPIARRVDLAQFERGRLTPSDDGRLVVSSGRILWPQAVTIVDTERRRALSDGEIGEIWISGPCVGAGYWCGGETSAATFGARLTDGSGPFLRTGDLGAFWDGELFVTGRSKEIIVVRGRKIFPQDIEDVVIEAHEGLKPAGGAVFAIDDGQVESIVIVQEVDRTWLGKLDEPGLVSAIREAVLDAFDLGVHQILLVKPDAVPKTSSGKIRRVSCRQMYLAGAFDNLLASQSPRKGIAQVSVD